MQLTLEELSDKLSGHAALFFIRRLTIVYFDSNVFLNHFNSLCTGVDLCFILRFIQRVKLSLIVARMATEIRKRAHFKYVIKSKLFSTYGSITHSASVCLMTYFRRRQRFPCPPALLLTFFHFISPLMVFKIPVCK